MDLTDKQKTEQIREVLRKKYHKDKGYLCLEELSSNQLHTTNGTSLCDMFCFSLWQSGGHKRIGIEIKVSKADLKKELENFSKSNVWFSYTNKWFLAIPDTLSLEGFDIPDSWGIITVGLTSKRARVAKEAEYRECLLDEGLMASIVLKMQLSSIDINEHRKIISDTREHITKYEREKYKQENGELSLKDKEEFERLKEIFDIFRDKTGLWINKYDDLEKIKRYANLIKTLLDGWQSVYERINDATKTHKDIVKKLEEIQKDPMFSTD